MPSSRRRKVKDIGAPHTAPKRDKRQLTEGEVLKALRYMPHTKTWEAVCNAQLAKVDRLAARK